MNDTDPKEPTRRVVLMADGWVGLQMARLLRFRGDEVVALFVHSLDGHSWADEIIEATDVSPNCIFSGNQLKDANVVQRIRDLEPEFILSITWSHILKQEVIDIPAQGAINIHNGLLPFNRGWHSNVWSIVEGTPSGVTLHYIDAGIDTGDIIQQQEVPVELTDTAATLHEKLVQAMWQLLEQTWPEIATGLNYRIPHLPGDGTHHYRKELSKSDHIDLDQEYTARELINLLRARTFAPYPGAYFVEDGKKVFVRVSLEEDSTVVESDKLTATTQEARRHAS
ncbi:MAG: methionyl-tRNA formyltransferase [Pirellulales bacterium]